MRRLLARLYCYLRGEHAEMQQVDRASHGTLECYVMQCRFCGTHWIHVIHPSIPGGWMREGFFKD